MKEFKIKSPVAAHLIISALVLLLMAVAAWAVFFKDDGEIQTSALWIASTFIFGIGGIVLYFAIKMMVLKPNVILINEKGFEYNPGGISSGFIPWSNVQEIKRVEVRTQQGQLNGPIWETTIGIKLKDPEPYRKQFNIILRGLMSLNDSMYDTDLFIRISSLGKKAAEAEQLLMSKGNTEALQNIS